MATFKFTGQVLDITENPDGSARRLSDAPATLTIKTSADTGFFQYRIEGVDSELPDILVTGGNITAANVNGVNVLDAEDIDASLGVIGLNGVDRFVIAFRTLNDENERSDLALFSLDGPDLPTITSAGVFNSILGSAEFSRGTGEFAPNTRIVLNDLDQVDFTAGVPLQRGTGGADVIAGDSNDDNIDAGGGSDEVNGGRGNDTIKGGGGADTLTGAAGQDELSGGGGSDVLIGGGGKDTLIGNGGKDELKGGGGSDDLQGGGGKDTLEGQGGRDTLDGGGGKDTLDGGGGNDQLNGGRGVDELTGGRGADTFEFARGSGRDTITDFQNRSDKFSIGQGATSFDDLVITQVETDAVITFSNVRITVEDTDISLLDASDFIFG